VKVEGTAQDELIAVSDQQVLTARAARVQPLKDLVLRREAAITGTAIAMFAFFSITADEFLTTESVIDMARAMAFTAIAGVGMTFLFIAGELDLSVGALYGFASVVFAWFVSNQGLDLWSAFVLTLLLGVAVGLTNGLLTTLIGIPSFIVTLGMLSLLRGAGLWLSGSFPIPIPSELKSSFLSLSGGDVGSVPAHVFWMIGVLLIGAIILRFTVFGYHVYATGGNQRAARQSGISTARVKLACFVMTSGLVALIGALQVGWLGSATPTTGAGFELEVIGAVIIGGTSLFGGEGSIFGTLVGAAILSMLASGLVFLGFSTDTYAFFTGVVIIIAAMLDVLLRRKHAIRVPTWVRRSLSRT
jgi:ribose transport system permease protein